jgi:hypothetical protein
LAEGTLATQDAEIEMKLRVEFPMRTVSLNRRPAHWAAASRRAKKERRQTYFEMRSAFSGQMTLEEIMGPILIRLIRTGPSSGLDSHDNLRGSFKAVVDGIADWLGIKDDDPRLHFEYAQGRANRWRVIIEVESPYGTKQ